MEKIYISFLFLVQQSILLYADPSGVLDNLGAKHLLRDKREFSDKAIAPISKIDVDSVFGDSISAWDSWSSKKEINPADSWPDASSRSNERYWATYSDLTYDAPCGVHTVGKEPSRIVGGQDAQAGEFPWQALLLGNSDGFSYMCGGLIVNAEWVATAGHCIITTVDKMTVVVGEYKLDTNDGSEQVLGVLAAYLDNYNPNTAENDIALLKVTKINLNGIFTAPICIPREGVFYGAGTPAIVSGWGTMSEGGSTSNTLQKVTVPIVDKHHCDEVYTNAGAGDQMHESQVCAGTDEGGKDSCQGDSGGPMICQMDDGMYYLCGIVSIGIGCGRPGIPGIYTSPPFFSKWINQTMTSSGGSKDSWESFDSKDSSW